MKIVADENIPLLHETFSGLGEVVALPGRSISPDDLVGADALLVRSVTKVNASLVTGSSLKFVGSCTAGVDHVDGDALAELGISFANAPGCNARSVVEYVISALDVLAERDGFRWQDRTVGIIGKGQVGGRLYGTLAGLDVQVMANDPLCEQVEGVQFVELEELIQRCDVIAVHTPLTKNCDFPSHHLIGEAELDAMKPGTILINAGRGPVVDNRALLKVLKAGKNLSAVLDVWEHEPEVDPELLAWVDIGTPHIAGYSLDGKVTGTEMVYQSLCQTFGLPARVRLGAITPIPVLRKMIFTEDVTADQAARLAMRAIYDIRRDDARLRQSMKLPEVERAVAFDVMRKNYAERREFGTLRVRAGRCTEAVRNTLSGLGLQLVD
ncbi:4-phosphoerythronate dehydrogenase PdxB [Endozoicomonas sp. OPT23]|uniref:4-phosphoerythronate dehydrogenase PdxB n=1 Tax=Endozoicomonas sp. OPT23 TaxID=2072845 RepID=UPI00129A6F18|nr:4-phosphoerythronate dehydrogenase PdxB [Endozoicomonas sp. OPT23]MRI35403.1 4-phosphoerythronate dehydrogenase PdxB [Endozoicomonas sp. OPT23]